MEKNYFKSSGCGGIWEHRARKTIVGLVKAQAVRQALDSAFSVSHAMPSHEKEWIN